MFRYFGLVNIQFSLIFVVMIERAEMNKPQSEL